MILELNFVTYIRMFLSLSRDISISGDSFLFGHCHLTFPHMELLTFFGRFVKKVIVSCISSWFVQKTMEQKGVSAEQSLRTRGKMAAVIIQVIPSFYTICSKNSLFISANTYEKFILRKEYCIAPHDDKMCFRLNCRYHKILIDNIK